MKDQCTDYIKNRNFGNLESTDILKVYLEISVSANFRDLVQVQSHRKCRDFRRQETRVVTFLA